jgi:hypothetical protein
MIGPAAHEREIFGLTAHDAVAAQPAIEKVVRPPAPASKSPPPPLKPNANPAPATSLSRLARTQSGSLASLRSSAGDSAALRPCG